MVKKTTPLHKLNNAIAKISAYNKAMILGLVFMFGVLLILPGFFDMVEMRKGVVLNDIVLNRIPPANVSIAIFIIMWGMALLMFIRAIQNPSVIALYVWTYFFILLTRMATIWVFKLDPPVGLIPLKDPVTGIIYGEKVINKDLFYSGHTATLTLILLTLRRKWDKLIAFIALIALVVLLLVQHVHYTIDIIAAPLFVYYLRKMTNYMLNRWYASVNRNNSVKN